MVVEIEKEYSMYSCSLQVAIEAFYSTFCDELAIDSFVVKEKINRFSSC